MPSRGQLKARQTLDKAADMLRTSSGRQQQLQLTTGLLARAWYSVAAKYARDFGDFAACRETLLAEVLPRRPDRSRFHQLVGECAMAAGLLEEAAAHFARCAEVRRGGNNTEIRTVGRAAGTVAASTNRLTLILIVSSPISTSSFQPARHPSLVPHVI